MDERVNIFRCRGIDEIKKKLSENLENYSDILPADRDALILLKPNLNSNMNALTGNTTDLRIIAATVEFLKRRGYRNIVIGEGTNSGFYRNNISVISRLAVDKLAKYYVVEVVDLNYSKKVEIEFEDGVKAGVAKECFEADFLINMPKFKTHFEVGMSICLKNLMGCLVGQENKKKAHRRLAGNIINLNKQINPQLHIVDGLIAMEGLGPSKGTPLNLGIILTGTDPYLLDLICAKIAGFDYRKIPTLKLAEEEGIVGNEYFDYIDSLNIRPHAHRFEKPKANLLVRLVHSPKRQPFFLAVRNTAFFNYLASTRFFGYLLFLSGLRQDNFINAEMAFEGLSLDQSRCNNCMRCYDYCPVSLRLPEELGKKENGCIECLYCFLVCPEKAIGFKGRFGFLSEQLRQYDEMSRRIS